MHKIIRLEIINFLDNDLFKVLLVDCRFVLSTCCADQSTRNRILLLEDTQGVVFMTSFICDFIKTIGIR